MIYSKGEEEREKKIIIHVGGLLPSQHLFAPSGTFPGE